MLMKFPQQLIYATLIRRYKRFLADVKLPDGNTVTVHCPNSGSMLQCAEPNWKVALTPANNPKRKTQFTWQLVHNKKCWIAINTHLSNHIVSEAIKNKQIPEVANYNNIQNEVTIGNSRIDIKLTQKNLPDCYIEVKNVTLLDQNKNYTFPDSITTRGTKHIQELIQVKQNGKRAILLFLIQRSDGQNFTPAKTIDPKFAQTLKNAYENGVEILPYQTTITPKKITITKKIKLII